MPTGVATTQSQTTTPITAAANKANPLTRSHDEDTTSNANQRHPRSCPPRLLQQQRTPSKNDPINKPCSNTLPAVTIDSRVKKAAHDTAFTMMTMIASIPNTACHAEPCVYPGNQMRRLLVCSRNSCSLQCLDSTDGGLWVRTLRQDPQQVVAKTTYVGFEEMHFPEKFAQGAKHVLLLLQRRSHLLTNDFSSEPIDHDVVPCFATSSSAVQKSFSQSRPRACPEHPPKSIQIPSPMCHMKVELKSEVKAFEIELRSVS